MTVVAIPEGDDVRDFRINLDALAWAATARSSAARETTRWLAAEAAPMELFSKSKIICCARNPAWFLDSLEQLIRRNALDCQTVRCLDPFGKNNFNNLSCRSASRPHADLHLGIILSLRR